MQHFRRDSLLRNRTRPILRLENLEDRANPVAFAGWEDLAALPVRPATDVAYLHPTQYRPLQIRIDDLRSELTDAPSETAVSQGANPKVITLPAPDGTQQRFSVLDAPVMAPELAAQFPEIETFKGTGIDDPNATVQLDISPLGFHAQVLSSSGTWYIDPYFHLNTDVGISYFRKDLTPSAVYPSNLVGPTAPRFSSVLDTDIHHDVVIPTTAAKSTSAAPTAARSTGTQLRTYRLAVAATGEYTAFHGGTVPLGQAAIVSTINRVSGVYESELSIRLQLVANNSNLVYTNAATDPYTNNDPGLLLDQNQTNIDSLIGSANYDIGHVFSTGGGGLAALGVVGQAGFKAQGETGSGSPIGDPFDIDYVAHEIGHQFGAEHSFNTSSDSNREPTTAFEPGSGSTIMGYAGITGANSDLQPNSDPFFNTGAFDQIIQYVDSTIPNVGTRTNTGNAIPTVNAGLDYVIPANTPFVLTASGSDSNGDTLTYSWEQRDLGPATLLNSADNGASPLFRVWNPTTDPSRTFPRLSNLINNTVPVGEQLPTANRTAMKFRVTVRDNRANGGGVNTDDMQVRVVSTGAAFAVTAPNTAVSWSGGSSQTVTWNVAGTTANNINAANVNITLSTDGGLTYPITLASNVPNDGSQAITVPNVNTSQARVRVQGAGNIFFDISNTNFTISSTAAAPTATFDVVSPDPRSAPVDSLGITFSEAISGFDINDLELRKNNVVVPLTGASVSTTDDINWTINNLTSLTTSSGQYQLKLIAAGSNIVSQANSADLLTDATVSWNNDASANNTAPVIDTEPIIVLPALPVYDANPTGTPISDLTANVTDADTGDSKGIAITGVSGTGSWQYSTDTGTTWTNVPKVSTTSAFLLGETPDTLIRFKPNKGYVGFARLNYKAWDQTFGTSGTNSSPAGNSFSTNTESAWVDVGNTPFKVDAAGNTTLTPIKEDTKISPIYTVSNILGIRGLELPPKTKVGIAVTNFDTTDGTWQYNLSLAAKGWTNVPAVDAANALLLRPTDHLRFLPNANADGGTEFSFRIWDLSSGTPGSQADSAGAGFSAGATNFIDLSPINDAPVLDLSAPAILDPVVSTLTTNVASFSSLMSASDVEGVTPDVAVTAYTGNGIWQFQIPGGTVIPFPKIPAGKVFPLPADATIQFTASSSNIKLQTATLSFKAWDRTTGNEATLSSGLGTAFSKEIERVTVAVNNNYPDLLDTSPKLPNVKSGKVTTGVAISTLLNKAVQDTKGALTGIAVTGIDEANGTWQYLVGTVWKNIGTVSETNALLLASTNRIRFVSNLGYTGTATITYKAWDRTAGEIGDRDVDTTGLLNSFSPTSVNATVTVIS